MKNGRRVHVPKIRQKAGSKQPQKEHKPEAEELPAVSEENPLSKRREAEKRLAETEQMFNGLEHKLTSQRARNASLKKSALKINKETAVQGIIFSEVLGPPVQNRIGPCGTSVKIKC